MLTVGIVTAMGIASTTNADTVSYGGNANTFTVKNVATGTYNVTGNDTQQKAESNEVTINVAETGSFSLVTTGGSNVADDVNDNIDINPTKDARVDFIHVLKNEGNVTDNYNIVIKNEGGDQFDYSLAGSTIIYQKLDCKGELIASSEIVIANGGTTPELAQVSLLESLSMQP